jgi:chemotaxis protein CheZ
MAVGDTRHLERVAQFVREKRASAVGLADVVALAEITAESLTAFFETMDSAIYRELREIATYIASTKAEIGALQVNDIKSRRIPAAGQELDAIVRATETATNTIMEAAEAVMCADIDDPVAYKIMVDEKMMAIFEACSFQDITGQRVKKVIETLEAIETRVTRFADAVRATDAQGFLDTREAERAERAERLMLNGPALAGDGIDQNDVDSLLGPPPKTKTEKPSAQDDIDALFA